MSFLHPIKFAFKALLSNACSYRKNSSEFLAKYYSPDGVSILTGHEVVCTFDGSMHHGGLGDRLRGIASVYEYCKRHNRTFKINFFDPFCLNTFLLPNKYDWRISADQISHNSNDAKPVIFDCDLNMFETYIHRKVMEKEFDTDKQIHVYTNTYCYDEFYSQNFNELFKPSPLLQSAIDVQLRKIGGKYISVSFRFCQLLGSFAQDVYKPLSEVEQVELINKSIQVIYQLKSKHPECSKIIVTSDSNKFIEMIKDIPFVYLIPGTVSHSNYKAADESQLKTFLDFFVIGNAVKVYMARTQIMYKSGFAHRAALINNTPFEEYNYK